MWVYTERKKRSWQRKQERKQDLDQENKILTKKTRKKTSSYPRKQERKQDFDQENKKENKILTKKTRKKRMTEMTTKKFTKTREYFRGEGEKFLAGRNIYPCQHFQSYGIFGIEAVPFTEFSHFWFFGAPRTLKHIFINIDFSWKWLI